MNINRTAFIFMLAIMLLAILPLAVSASGVLPVRVDRVRIDSIDIQDNATNRLDIQRGQEVEVEVTFTSLAAAKNIQMEAFMSGFEYSDIAPLSATTRVFDMEENVTYVRRVRLKISDEVQQDDYKLRVLITDRNDQELIKNFNLKIDVPRNGLKVEDVVFFPAGSVEAGKALLTTVRLENKGQKDQKDVRVQISIPELGVSGADYIDEVRHDQEKGTEEIFMRIPESAKSGKYSVRVDVDFNQLHDHITAVRDIMVVGGSASSGSSGGSGSQGSSGGSNPPSGEPKTVITINSQLETVTPGKGGALYPITIVNNDDGARTFSLSASGADWADVKVSPSSTLIIDRGDAKLFSVYVTPRGDAKVGTQSLTVVVSSNGKVLKEIPLTANILPPPEASVSPTVVRVLEAVFIILLVVLVIMGLVIAFKRREGAAKDDSSDNSQTYY